MLIPLSSIFIQRVNLKIYSDSDVLTLTARFPFQLFAKLTLNKNPFQNRLQRLYNNALVVGHPLFYQKRHTLTNGRFLAISAQERGCGTCEKSQSDPMPPLLSVQASVLHLSGAGDISIGVLAVTEEGKVRRLVKCRVIGL